MTTTTAKREYTEVNGTLYAFWRYDLFPFVCGGPVTRMSATGAVETSNYGCGSFFKPFKIVPRAEGEAIMAKIKALDKEHYAARDAFNKAWLDKVVEVIDFPNPGKRF